MSFENCDVLVKNIGQLLTLSGVKGPLINPDRNSLGIIENGYISIKDGRIVDIGSNCTSVTAEKTIDAEGNLVLPGFIDPHTHLIFGGSREKEFSMRLKGKNYLEIMKEGGGIKSTVEATRRATKEELFRIAIERLDTLLSWGTTTCEIKTGYGLNTESELKMLEVASVLQNEHTVDIISTFLGAHEIPVEFDGNREGYIEVIIDEMIPQVSKRKLARFCDVFCEKGVFNKEETEKILNVGLDFNLQPKMHVDEFFNIGGCEICERVNAVSCDHLLYTDEKGLFSMKKAKSIAVLLPGTNFFLMKKKIPPVNKMREIGIPIAIATDFNPGSSPLIAMPVIIGLACLLYGLTVEEAIAAATINAAYAVKEESRVGSLEKDKVADILVFDFDNYEEVPYWFAQNRLLYVIKKGEVVAGKRKENMVGIPK
jgi:imidazolonepropionase